MFRRPLVQPHAPDGLPIQQDNLIARRVLRAVALFLPRVLDVHEQVELRRSQRRLREFHRAHVLEQRKQEGVVLFRCRARSDM